MSFTRFVAERRRGVLLGALADCAPEVAVASDLLQRYLMSINLRATQDEVEADLAWLHTRALVATGRSGPLLTAVITRAGRDVATRLVTVPGVDVADTRA
jgi:hypothetical protein